MTPATRSAVVFDYHRAVTDMAHARKEKSIFMPRTSSGSGESP